MPHSLRKASGFPFAVDRDRGFASGIAGGRAASRFVNVTESQRLSARSAAKPRKLIGYGLDDLTGFQEDTKTRSEKRA